VNYEEAGIKLAEIDVEDSDSVSIQLGPVTGTLD